MNYKYETLAISTENGLDALNNKLAELVEKAYQDFLEGDDFCMIANKDGVTYEIDIWQNAKQSFNTLVITNKHSGTKEFYDLPSVRRCFLELKERCLVDF